MKKILIFTLFSSFIVFASCQSNSERKTKEEENQTESRGFGGEGADPSSGPVVSDDTAMTPTNQGSQNDSTSLENGINP